MKVEHPIKIMHRKRNIPAPTWNRKKMSKCNGEETKYKSFAAKDIVKERYLWYYRLGWLHMITL
jgi:hypothetical protein